MTETNTVALAGSILCGVVALEHFLIFVMETFLWHSRGHKVFGMKSELSRLVSPVMAQVGCYNLFLSLGLIWAVAWKSPNEKILFLTFVLMAASFGATSVQPRILLTQGGPALVGLLLVTFGEKNFDAWGSGDHGGVWMLLSLLAGGTAAALGALWKRHEQQTSGDKV